MCTRGNGTPEAGPFAIIKTGFGFAERQKTYNQK